MSELRNGIKTFHAKTQQEWRDWLTVNHAAESAVWLIIYKKKSGVESVYYPETAVPRYT